jgi:hypothetical protein
MRWHPVVSDLEAECHSSDDPLPTGFGLRLSRLRDNETSAHRDSGVPSCDDLLRCLRLGVGRTGDLWVEQKAVVV